MRVRSTAYMSNGYTTAFASTAPVAPANALPHGGNGGGAAVPAISQGPLGCERTDKSRDKPDHRLRPGCVPLGGKGRCAVSHLKATSKQEVRIEGGAEAGSQYGVTLRHQPRLARGRGHFDSF